MKRILVVDDSQEVQLLVKRALGSSCETTPTFTLDDAMDNLSEKEFDLVLLDVLLPDGNGFDSFLPLRAAGKNSAMPILFLTNSDEPADRIMGYRLGADDYIPKSVSPIELRTRIEARLRGGASQAPGGGNLRKGPLRFDTARQAVFAVEGAAERDLELTNTEFKLLFHFARHEEHVLHRDQLLAAVWASDTCVADRVIDVYVCGLRKKISGSGYTIKPVYGAGYRFLAE